MPLTSTGLPGFNEELERHAPSAVVDLKSRILAADAVLIATPEYTYSVPGGLKNAIHWASRPYGQSARSGKPAAIMGASVGAIGTARAQYHLRQMMVFLNMSPVNQPEVMIGSAPERFDANGTLTNEDTKKHVQDLMVAFVDWTRKLKTAATS